MITTEQTPALKFDPHRLKQLALQNAATVIYICENRDPGTHAPGKRFQDTDYDPVTIVMDLYLHRSPSDYYSYLESMVEFIYDFAGMYLKGAIDGLNLDTDERKLIRTALYRFQQWKIEGIAAYASHAGSAANDIAIIMSGRNDRDWSNLNHRI